MSGDFVHRDRRDRVALLVAVSVVLVAAACGSDADPSSSATTSATSAPSTTAQQSEVVAASTPPNVVQPTATIPISEHVDGGTVTDDAVWAAVDATDTLHRIDPVTNSVVQELSAPGLGFRFDIGHDSAWVTDFDGSVLRRIALDGSGVVAEISTGLNPEGVAVTDDAVWVANHRDGTVTRIDPGTNAVVATVEVGLAGPAGPQTIAATSEVVWVGVPNTGEVVAIDTTTNAVVERVESDATCGEMEVLGDAVWITNCFESGDVAVIESGSANARAVLDGSGRAGSILLIDDEVWLATIDLEDPTGKLVNVDPSTLEVIQEVAVRPAAYNTAAGFDSLWQFSWDTGAVIRLPLAALASP